MSLETYDVARMMQCCTVNVYSKSYGAPEYRLFLPSGTAKLQSFTWNAAAEGRGMVDCARRVAQELGDRWVQTDQQPNIVLDDRSNGSQLTYPEPIPNLSLRWQLRNSTQGVSSVACRHGNETNLPVHEEFKICQSDSNVETCLNA